MLHEIGVLLIYINHQPYSRDFPIISPWKSERIWRIKCDLFNKFCDTIIYPHLMKNLIWIKLFNRTIHCYAGCNDGVQETVCTQLNSVEQVFSDLCIALCPSSQHQH